MNNAKSSISLQKDGLHTIIQKKSFDDKVLVAKIQATHDTKAFAQLYDKYAQKVFSKCYSFARDKMEAEDLTQDVFIKLFTKLHTFKGTSSFSTWLYSFTYNFCVNYVKRDKARKNAFATEKMDQHEYHISNDEEDVNEEILLNLKVELLEEALMQIPTEDKVLLLLKYQDDVSIKELEALYNLSSSALKMRLKRARIRVLKHYKIKV